MTPRDRLIAAGLRPSEADTVLSNDLDLEADLATGAALREAVALVEGMRWRWQLVGERFFSDSFYSADAWGGGERIEEEADTPLAALLTLAEKLRERAT